MSQLVSGESHPATSCHSRDMYRILRAHCQQEARGSWAKLGSGFEESPHREDIAGTSTPLLCRWPQIPLRPHLLPHTIQSHYLSKQALSLGLWGWATSKQSSWVLAEIEWRMVMDECRDTKPEWTGVRRPWLRVGLTRESLVSYTMAHSGPANQILAVSDLSKPSSTGQVSMSAFSSIANHTFERESPRNGYFIVWLILFWFLQPCFGCCLFSAVHGLDWHRETFHILPNCKARKL